MKFHIYYVYILSNKNNTVLYTGVTVDKLIYFETFNFIELAINREKQIKGYSRMKKELLINSLNPEWMELYNEENIKIPHSAALHSE